MVDAINENTDGVAQGGGSVKSVNGVSPDSKGNVNTPKTDLSGYATKESVTNAQNTANSAQAAVDGLVTSGRNLVLNTSNPANTNHWQVASYTQGTLSIVKHEYYSNGQLPLFYLSTNSIGRNTMVSTDRFNVKPNTKYTFQFKGFNSSNLKGSHIWFLGRKYGSSKDYDLTALVFFKTSISTDSLTEITGVFDSGDVDEAYLRIDNDGSTDGKQSFLYFTDVEIAEGPNIPVYSPNPDDKANDAEVGHLAKDQTWAGVNNFQKLIGIQGFNIPHIPGGSDLDNYRDTGFFEQISSTDVATTANIPFGTNHSYYLQVMAGANYVTQVAWSHSEPALAIRTYSAQSKRWSAWTSEIFLNRIADLTQNQTFTGFNTFTGGVQISGKTPATTDQLLDNSTLVHKSGNETIAGTKNFTGTIQINGVSLDDYIASKLGGK